MTAHDRSTRRTLAPQQGRLPDRSSSRAVLVGVSAYRDSELENVPAAANNVHQLQDLLTGNNGGFAAEHCEVLLNWDDCGRIGGTLAAAAREATDVLLVYFTGHGLHGASGGGVDLFLALPGTDPRLPAYTALHFDAIRETFRTSGASVKILILDCCYSGLAIGRPLSGSPSVGLDQIAIKSAAVLVSSGPFEPSRVRDGHPFTAFTDALVSVLRDGIPGAGPLLKLSDIASQTHRRLVSEGFPVPHRLEVGNAGSLALVRNTRADQCRPEGCVSSGHRDRIKAADDVPEPAADSAAADPAGALDLDSAQDILDATMRGFEPGHPAIVAGRRVQAEHLAQTADLAQAGALLHSLVADAERILGPLHPEALRCRLVLGGWMTRQDGGDAIAIVRLLTELEQALVAVLGHDAPETRNCRRLRYSRDLRRRETEQVLRDRTRADR